MAAKSIIARPVSQKLTQTGFHEITGMPGAGHGKAKRVDFSVDGGKNWQERGRGRPC